MIALVHDWLTGMRGGEKALEVLCELYPEADLFTLLHVPGSVSPTIERLEPKTSFLQRLPKIERYYRQCLPLFPIAVERFNLDRYRLIISLSHCAAKAVVKPPRAIHLCYCLTPMRYAWDQFDAYFGAQRVGRVRNLLARPALSFLRRWDRVTARRVDRYVAISRYVAERIRRYYNRAADVIYPPVDTAFYHPNGAPAGGYFLIVSALVPYKRIDRAIAASRLTGLPLRIVGDGPARPELEQTARQAPVEFLGRRSNEEIRDLYRGAAAVVLPGEEDFGIAPVEAQACGRPVVALARGGAVETVVDGETGVLVEGERSEDLARGFEQIRANRWDEARIRQHAESFSRARFAREFSSYVKTLDASLRV